MSVEKKLYWKTPTSTSIYVYREGTTSAHRCGSSPTGTRNTYIPSPLSTKNDTYPKPVAACTYRKSPV